MDRFNLLLRLIFLLFIPALLAYGAYVFLSTALFSARSPQNTAQISVEVSPGMTFKDVCKLLQEKGVIRYARALDLIARLKGSPTDKIKAGEYMLSAALTPQQILTKLVSGDIFNRKVLLSEGQSIRDLGRIVEEAGLISKAEIDKVLYDPALLARAGISSSSFEGYLFPNTYLFSRPISAKEVVWRLLEEGEKHWPIQYSDKADSLAMSRHEILTLASIIQKEAGRKEEMPLISSVFHNRLKQGMKLQSDPTVIYGLPNYNGNITKEDLQNPHPYNTYTNLGLPPGPICCPGEDAIVAALNPAETKFLFFVADGTGGHAFAATLAEHNQNVAKFLLGEKQAAEARAPEAAPTPAATAAVPQAPPAAAAAASPKR